MTSLLSATFQPLKGRSVLGLSRSDLPFMNFLRGAAFMQSTTVGYPAVLNVDGYPTSAPATSISGQLVLPSNYYGRYRVQFSGTGSMELAGQFIVYSGNSFVDMGALAFTLRIWGQTNPTIEFSYGTLISGAANNGSGAIRLTVGSTTNVITGSLYTVQGVVGTAEANGVWAVTVIDGTHFDLQGSAFSHAYISGGEAIAQVSTTQFAFPSGQTYGSMSNAILCRKADIDGTNAFGLQAGYQINADLVSLLQTIRPYAVRFLNLNTTINSIANDYFRRPQLTAFSWGGDAQFVPAYWVGNITRGVSDAYTCSNPSASGGGVYADGEVVQGVVDLVNLTTTPTLNLGARGAKPVFVNTAQTIGVIGGTIAAGHTINLIFTGSYIAGSPYHLVYTTVAGDAGNPSALANNLLAAINGNTTLQAANISADRGYDYNVGVAYIVIIYNRNAGSGTTFSYTSTGAETLSFGTCVPNSSVPANTVCTFAYSAVLGGWIFQSGGLLCGLAVPPEVLCELCNRVPAAGWFQIPMLYSAASTAAFATTVRDNLAIAQIAFFELSNEIWNFAQQCTTTARNLGACLGLSFQGGLGQLEGFFGLRTRQFMEIVVQVWTAGRYRNTLKCMMAHSFGAEDSAVNGGTQLYRFNGTDLTTSNPTYAALGGLGGMAGKTYTAIGQRPIDVCDGASYATYYAGVLVTNFATGQGWTGPIATYDPILQAGTDYATGIPLKITSALNAFDTDLNNNLSGLQSKAASWESVYATYDVPRANLGLGKLEVWEYEGGYEGTTGNNFNDSNSPTPLANQFAANGWNTAPYGANNTIVAQQVVNAFFAYKNSSQFAATVGTVFGYIVSAHAGRVAYPSWFNMSGPSIWSLYPGDPYTVPYKSWNSLVTFNSRR